MLPGMSEDRRPDTREARTSDAASIRPPRAKYPANWLWIARAGLLLSALYAVVISHSSLSISWPIVLTLWRWLLMSLGLSLAACFALGPSRHALVVRRLLAALALLCMGLFISFSASAVLACIASWANWSLGRLDSYTVGWLFPGALAVSITSIVTMIGIVKSWPGRGLTTEMNA